MAKKFDIPSPSAAFPFESRYVTIQGHRIHYVETGEGNPIVMMHGNPTSSYLYRNVLAPVAQSTGRRAIAFDLLGFGKSDKPTDLKYSLQLHADVVGEFIDQLNLKNLILVGDDWGGVFASDYATRHPDRIQGLVLMETFLWPMTWDDDFSPEFRKPFKLMRSPLGYLFTQVFNIMIKKLIPDHCPISKDSLNHYIGAFPTIRSRNAVGAFPKLIPINGKPLASYEFFMNLQDRLRKFRAPVTWIKASPGVVPSDDYAPQAKRWDEMRDLLPQLQMKSFGTGYHFLAEERPERVSELVIEFVRDIEATQPEFHTKAG